MGRKKIYEINGTNVRRRKDWGRDIFKDDEISESKQTPPLEAYRRNIWTENNLDRSRLEDDPRRD